MDFLFLFDCDCLRHKEGIRCTLVNADSCDSRNGKMPYIKFCLARSQMRCTPLTRDKLYERESSLQQQLLLSAALSVSFSLHVLRGATHV